jgi:PTH1 family peptidyl-tRNA hydrolase
MHVIVGLRNPGADYDGTRHNVGFEVLATLAARYGGRFKRGPLRVRVELADLRIGPERAVLAVPISYMNESGVPVRSVLDYHKVDSSRLLVVHDDIDLAFGRLRLQVGGGSGGHNGLKSIERALGTRDWTRLKLGVGRPPGDTDPADFVLKRFSKAERPEVDLQVEDAADVAEKWLTDPPRAQEMAAHRRLEAPER